MSSLIFDEYSHEEEQIPFVDLMNNQPVYDSYSQEEDIQRFYDLQLKQQQEVFVFSFIDPFSPCLESLSSLDVRALLSKEGRLFFSFEFHINILWFPAFFVSRSKKSTSQLFVWLHWKSDYT